MKDVPKMYDPIALNLYCYLLINNNNIKTSSSELDMVYIIIHTPSNIIIKVNIKIKK